ncbi:MAG: tetratricopeptide repeat protein [Lachnospiraceae bacterium]|nr:tetratricopeptide repeat protein [Lachnospiraceae bacterium]
MSDKEKVILKNFAISPNEQLPADYKKWIVDEYDDYALEYQNLMLKGWINKQENNYEMHPVMKEAILLQEKPELEDVQYLLDVMISDWWLLPGTALDIMIKRFNIAEKFLCFFSNRNNKMVQVLVSVLADSLLEYCMFSKAQIYAEMNMDNDILEYGQCSWVVARDYFRLAKIHNETNKLNIAEWYCEDALAIFEEIEHTSDKDRLYYDILFVYGTISAKQKNTKKARMLYEAANNVESELVKEEDRVDIQLNLFALMIEERKYQEAYDILQDVKEATIKCKGKECMEITFFYQNCANLFFEYFRDYKKALEYDTLALEIRREIQEKHTSTAQSYYSVAYDLYMLQCDFDKCKEYAQKSYDIYSELLGSLDINTKMAEQLVERLQ